MPDIITVIFKKWKLIFGLTLAATVLAFGAALISPKKYLSTATAIPANTTMSDKARIFNTNIETLYSEFGSTDDLDRIEGAAALDTIFIATASQFDLASHYNIEASADANYKAAKELKHNTDINKSAYGELKVKVWDKERNIAAEVSNALLQKLQDLYQHLQNESNAFVLQKIKEDYAIKQDQFRELSDSFKISPSSEADLVQLHRSTLLDQLKEYIRLIDQYEMAVKTNPPLLLMVEKARPSLLPDKPDIIQTVVFTFFCALVFSFLLSLFIVSRNNNRDTAQ